MKVGDKVEVINFFNHYFVQRGIVEEIDEESDKIVVNFGDDKNEDKKICHIYELKVVIKRIE